MTSTSGQNSAASFKDEFSRVSDAGLRHSLLRRLIQERMFVSVILPRHSERYNSTLLEMQADGGLLLDELYPEEGQGLVKEGGQLRIYARMDRQAALYFDTHVAEVGEEDGMRLYRLQPPEELHYLQRRSDFRVQVERVEHIPVSLHRENGSVLDGSLLDLSSGGASVLLESPPAVPLEEGELIKRCRIKPEGEAALQLQVDIRRIGEGQGPEQLLLGLRFHIKEPRDKQRLDRLVHRLERELLRHRYPV